ncbi:MAG: UbiA family prenyltransferase [Cyanobacteria bacterium NC_groundwater_1444_Ag_S-0.65um_54_12]|nr:UbiA family prenyltransferase [Cyanobacteria bacterium NC_groundwater_1444_Ag_S-0.65um_54_12]
MSTEQNQVVTTFPQRLWTYLREMFPLQVNVPAALLGFFVFYFLLQVIYDIRPLHITPQSLTGALTLLAFSLLTRIFDEFKDLESDRLLFPQRPLPAGRVLPRDLQALGWFLAGMMVTLNLFSGKAFIGLSILLGYGLLTYKYFFLPELHRKSLLLTVATHNPLVFVSHLYILSVFLADYRQSFWAVPPAVWLAILLFWLPVLSWEFSRKIRDKSEETAYVTYSQIFGPRLAGMLPVFCLTLATLLAWWFANQLAWSVYFRLALLFAYGFAMFGFGRWQWKQSPRTSYLKPFTEKFALLLYLSFLVELIARYGLQ